MITGYWVMWNLPEALTSHRFLYTQLAAAPGCATRAARARRGTRGKTTPGARPRGGDEATAAARTRHQRCRKPQVLESSAGIEAGKANHLRSRDNSGRSIIDIPFSQGMEEIPSLKSRLDAEGSSADEWDGTSRRSPSVYSKWDGISSCYDLERRKGVVVGCWDRRKISGRGEKENGVKGCWEKEIGGEERVESGLLPSWDTERETGRGVEEEKSEEATQGFHESLKIGQGGFGSIYKGLLRQTEVAIKRLQSQGSQGPSEFQMEVRVLSQLRHANLVKLIGSCPEVFALIYEYLPNGSLEDRLSCKDNSPPLSWQTRIRIATELCSVLVYLHCSRTSQHYQPLLIANDVKLALDERKLKSLLDPSAGDWPFEVAQELACLALRCCAKKRKNRPDLGSDVRKVLEPMRALCGASSSS
uniref:RING-type E3 ubiquitin transferase n=1 Tax=Fagus sylvatica TaxID=28930 RepID=A0A2N9FI27_FAGSY